MPDAAQHVNEENMIAIVTDSTADVPHEIIKELDIQVVPVYAIFGDDALRDGIDISRESFYARLRLADPLPTTSAPSTGDFDKVYRKLIDAGVQHIISIHLAAKLSATQNAALSAAGAISDAEITILDSEQLSMGLGWQVIEAARAAREGKSVQEIVTAVHRIRERVRVYALLDTLDFARRSGRVSWATAALGKLLKIKPLVEVRKSEVLSYDRARTRKQGLQKLKDAVRQHTPLQDLTVMHADALDTAETLAREFGNEHPDVNKPIHIVDVTTALGTHVGPNGVGVACVVKN